MNSSFYNGVSGIKVHQFGMDVWANNISNINNSGFKAERPEFSNIFSQSLTQSYFSPAYGQVGLGASGQTTAMVEEQGGIVDADNEFDMAIAGEGWFGTIDENGTIFYTRKGDFSIDGAGNLVATNGNILLGTLGDNIQDGQISKIDKIDLKSPNEQTRLHFPTNLSMEGQPTTNVAYKANLNPQIIKEYTDITLNENDIQSSIDETTNTLSIEGTIENTDGIFEPKEKDIITVTLEDKNGVKKQLNSALDADNKWSIPAYELSNLDTSEPLTITASLKTKQEIANEIGYSTTIISPEGEKQTLRFDFTKTIPQKETGTSWNAKASIINEKNEVVAEQEGELTFSSKGGLLSNSLTNISNGANDITLDFGTITDEKDGVFDGMTSFFGESSGENSVNKDGYVDGSLQQYQIENDGYIMAAFSNGITTPVGRIPIFHFQNDQGLSREGGDFFSQSSNSGEPLFYTDANGNTINGTNIASKKLEMSNVSLSTALTEVIVMQKGFDASSKSITTSDQMIQFAINMKK